MGAAIDIVVTDTNVYKLRTYMFTILDQLLSNKKYVVNANFLSKDKNNYSLDKIPTPNIEEDWIIPTKKYKEVYEFRSRNSYGMDEMDNLKNVGFFENFESIIYSNNDEGILPVIEGIESIECLTCGAINNADTQTSEFSTQIKINYIK